MAERRKALGRGLSALLPGNEATQQTLDINEIAFNPQQPRKEIDDTALQELADSIRVHGILQPLVVAPLSSPDSGSERYVLIAGERRLRAARLAGLQQVPVMIKNVEGGQSLEIALVENLQRQDLNPVEEAEAYKTLISGFGLTQDKVSERVGKSRSSVANSLRLLRLPAGVLTMLRSNQLSEGHARTLLALPEAAIQLQVAEKIVVNQLSVRQTEALVKHLLSQPSVDDKTQKTKEEPDLITRSIEEKLRNYFGTKVNVHRGKSGGTVVIHFYSDDDLQAILDTIAND